MNKHKVLPFLLGLICISVTFVIAILLRMDPDSVNMLRVSYALFGVTGLLMVGVATGVT